MVYLDPMTEPYLNDISIAIRFPPTGVEDSSIRSSIWSYTIENNAFLIKIINLEPLIKPPLLLTCHATTPCSMATCHRSKNSFVLTCIISGYWMNTIQQFVLSSNKSIPRGKAETHWTQFDNAARFFSFWKLIKQPMKGNFKRYVDQTIQNVIAFLNIWKTQTGIKVIGQRKSKNLVALSNRIRCVSAFNYTV